MKLNRKLSIIISIFLCVTLLFTFIASETIEVQAAAPIAIAASGTAVMAAFLATMGIYAENDWDQYEDLTIETWNQTPENIKQHFQQAGLALQIDLNKRLGYGSASIAESAYNNIYEWFTTKFSNTSGSIQGSIPSYVHYPNLSLIYKNGNTGAPDSSLLAEYYAGASPKILFYSNSFGWKIYTGRDYINLRLNDQNYTEEDYNGTTHTFTTSGAGSYIISTNDGNVYAMSGVQLTSSKYGAIDSFSDPVDISYNKLRSYNLSQLSTILNNGIKVPYTSTFTGVADYPIPDTTTIPIGSDVVVEHLQSMDTYFENENTIPLADGTTIDNLNDALLNNTDTLPNVSTGEGDLGLIGNVVAGISGILSKIFEKLRDIPAAIASAFAGLFDWTTNPKAPPVGGGIGTFFNPLLALLIAIMHLIAKVITFIGNLYAIPASTAMIHPTMLQGLYWARGFETAGGVNLFGLITGVISIVFGIVVFKLLRKMITGIGTASFIEEKEVIPKGSHRTGGW